MFKVKYCPECGRPYLPLYKALVTTVVFFDSSLIGLAVIGSLIWFLTHSENGMWVGRLVGLMGGGLAGYLLIRSWLKPNDGGEYCQRTDGA